MKLGNILANANTRIVWTTVTTWSFRVMCSAVSSMLHAVQYVALYCAEKVLVGNTWQYGDRECVWWYCADNVWPHSDWGGYCAAMCGHIVIAKVIVQAIRGHTVIGNSVVRAIYNKILIGQGIV